MAHSCSLLQEANGDPTSWIPEFAHCLSLSSVHGLKRSKAMKHLAACGRNDVEKDFSWWRGYEAIGATISDSADTLKTCPFRLLAFQSFCVVLDFASFATPPRFEVARLQRTLANQHVVLWIWMSSTWRQNRWTACLTACLLASLQKLSVDTNICDGEVLAL